jgi:hypothetical protein
MFFAHLGCLFFDLCQAPLHLAPAIPQGIIRVGMESSLEGPHTVFKEHDKKLLFDRRWGIVEGEEVRK